MRRIKVQKKAIHRRMPGEILPLDPRDPDIVRAKALRARRDGRERRHRAA